MTLWEKCLNHLQDELSSQQFNTWIRPLQAEYGDGKLILFAPNRFVLDWIVDRFLVRITDLARRLSEGEPPLIFLDVGSKRSEATKAGPGPAAAKTSTAAVSIAAATKPEQPFQSNLNLHFTFENFVEGKS